MAGYLVPISLLVLASFTLGLLVGRLLWASSNVPANQPDEPEAQDVEPEETSTSVRPAAGRVTEDPPTWQMKEVSSPQQPDAVGSPPW